MICFGNEHQNKQVLLIGLNDADIAILRSGKQIDIECGEFDGIKKLPVGSKMRNSLEHKDAKIVLKYCEGFLFDDKSVTVPLSDSLLDRIKSLSNHQFFRGSVPGELFVFGLLYGKTDNDIEKYVDKMSKIVPDGLHRYNSIRSMLN